MDEAINRDFYEETHGLGRDAPLDHKENEAQPAQEGR
jgi:hypothetical protein